MNTGYIIFTISEPSFHNSVSRGSGKNFRLFDKCGKLGPCFDRFCIAFKNTIYISLEESQHCEQTPPRLSKAKQVHCTAYTHIGLWVYKKEGRILHMNIFRIYSSLI